MVYATKPVLVLCGVLFASVVAAASQMLARQQPEPLQLEDYASYQCLAGSDQSLPELSVLSLSSFKAIDIANQLCGSSEVQSAFKSVTISWRKRGILTAQDIVEQHYDLVLNRRYLLQGLVPDYQRFYATLYDTPSYDVYWVAKNSQPELTAAYFADKTVGLSEDFFSQSMYLLPANSLLNAGIHLQEEQKHFYPDVTAMINALQRGEVDLIPSPDIGHWLTSMGDTYRLKLSEQAPSASWFVKRSARLNGIHCGLSKALRYLDVYAPAQPIEGCL